jgi:TolB-like protein
MQIWSAEIKELETFYTPIKGRFPELEKELERLIKTDDENIVLIYSRRCLEVIITDLCESELKRPRKTEPLKGIIDKLNREEKVPSHIIVSMQYLNSLSAFGAHPKEFDPEQVKPVLHNLITIIKWYLKYKDSKIDVKAEVEDVKDETKVQDESTAQAQKPNKRLALLLSGFALVCVIVVALVVFDVIGGGKQIKELEKSIAVLPFDNLSSDEEQAWFSDGITDVIINHLSKISDLRVLSRTSTIKYKETEEKKSLSEIGKELGVNFLIEGTVQREGSQMRVSVQLIQAINEDHLWSELYDREWKDIFSVQSEIAQTVAKELKAAITPEEKQLIEKIPTTNLTAYDFFNRGREEHWKYWMNSNDREALERAEDLYRKTLECDSTFAQAYTGLAWAYWDKHYYDTYFSEIFLDSMPILIDIALSFDDQLPEAYVLTGYYYRYIGKPEQAIIEYDKAIKLNPNDWKAYFLKGSIHSWVLEDYGKAIVNLQEAVIRNRGMELVALLVELGYAYQNAGFIDNAKYYFLEAFKLEGDSIKYYYYLGDIENVLGNYEKAIEFLEKGYIIDSIQYGGLLSALGYNYMFLGQYKESLKYYKKYLEILKARGWLSLGGMHRIGYVYWQNGYREEAEYYFNEQIKYGKESIKLGREYANNKYAHYDLAGVYAFLGDKVKAYQYLDEVNKKHNYPLWWISLVKHDPLFDSIREEERFQKILQNMEAKYQAEHERVRKWLEEQGML